MTPIRTLCLALALALTSLAPSAAQGLPETPQQQKDREFALVFQEGLYALTNREVPRAIQLFQRAVQLYPERPTAYYNLACAFSIQGKPEDSVKYLRLAFERGFNDLAHMSRDMDLDGIRNTPAYRQARGELEAAALADVPPALSKVPAAEGKLPLYVVIHGDQDQPAAVLERVAATTGAITPGAVLVPQGPFAAQGGGRAWRSQQEQGAGRLEFIVMERVRAFLEATPSIDRQQVFLIGLGFSGYKAVSIAGHHPDVFAGVYAHGPLLGAEAGELTVKTRAYLVVDPQDGGQVASGVDARNAVVDAEGAAVLERWSGTPIGALADGETPFARAVAWLTGKPVELPNAGASVPF